MRFIKIFFPPAWVLCAGLTMAQQKDLVSFVDPFIGTQEMGHTFPGACVPFGFVQLSPDTDTIPYDNNGRYNPEVYRYCAGYQYADNTIVGFSHTHFSGTGHSDLGDFLLMPTTGKVQLNPGTAGHPESGYRSRFDHSAESASPGYYRVLLKDSDILAELTATTRAGIHRYTFPESDSAHIILDLYHGIYNYDGKVLTSYIRVINDTLVTGYRITSGWARTRYIYFAMTFSKPFVSYGMKDGSTQVYRGFWRKFNQEENFPEMSGKKVRAHFDFRTRQGEAIVVKMALSAVSMDGALKNLQAEAPGNDFDSYHAAARAQWEKELERILVTADDTVKTTFYTSLYHALIHPVIYMDVDGRYRGVDMQIHKAEGFTNYTIFSLWDTYRALHPLLTLLYPDRTADMVSSMIAHYDQSPEQMLPVWSHHGNENWCMIGYHAVPVIADAWLKGIRGFDGEKALEACYRTACNPLYTGVNEYMKRGYVPENGTGTSASITLEYAYDDYAIAQLAFALGKDSLAKVFMNRSQNFRNLFDPSVGFFRAKNSDGIWKSPFDPLSTSGQGFVEGNSWNYSFYVPQDVPGLIGLMGGEKAFTRRLDSLFTMPLEDKYFAETEDVTRVGLIGNYVHGNEPSHHIPYLYNWTKSPWKTQERVDLILRTMYRNRPDGLCGNDDCGQMSAWYIFGALGFYPVCPGTPQYAVGAPLVKEAVIRLPGDKTLTIKASGRTEKNKYARKVTFNGNPLLEPFLYHPDLENGGEIFFEMSAKH